jgi:hypothetical protein
MPGKPMDDLMGELCFVAGQAKEWNKIRLPAGQWDQLSHFPSALVPDFLNFQGQGGDEFSGFGVASFQNEGGIKAMETLDVTGKPGRVHMNAISSGSG